LCPFCEKEIFDASQKLPYIRDIPSQGKNILAKILVSIGSGTGALKPPARPLKNAPFWPISASDSNFNPRNIQYIPVVEIFAFLDLDQN